MNIFKYYHIEGLHVPLRLDKDFHFKMMEKNHANYISQAQAILKLTGIFLKTLKDLGVYDRSMIFILGDHGSGRSCENYIPPVKELPDQKPGQEVHNFGFFKARGNPLLLVKPFGSTNELRISSVPAMLADIPETAASALAVNAGLSGRDLFSLKENEKRVRIYRAFEWSSVRYPAYLFPMTEYEVSGDSWLDASWKTNGNKYNPVVSPE